MAKPHGSWKTIQSTLRGTMYSFAAGIIGIFLSLNGNALLVNGAIACSAGEATLEVNIRPESEYFQMELIVKGPQHNMDSFFFAEIVVRRQKVVELCVPLDQCLTISIQADDTYWYSLVPTSFLTSDFFIVYNGQEVLQPLGPFAYGFSNGVRYYAELGGEVCALECASGDALVEVEAFTSADYGYDAEYDWQIIDEITGEIVHACAEYPSTFLENSQAIRCYWDNDWWFHDRVCLPRDGCYRLVAAESALDAPPHASSTFKVMYDGELVKSVDDLQFESIPLSSWNCSSPCNEFEPPYEQELEVFLFRDYSYDEQKSALSWMITDPKLTESTFKTVQGRISYDDRRFQYHQMCVPKFGGCVKFKLSGERTAPPSLNAYDQYTGMDTSYRLLVGGVIHSEGSWYWYEDNIYDFYDYFESGLTQFVGKCTSNEMCQAGQSIVSVDIVTGLSRPDWFHYSLIWEVVSYEKPLRIGAYHSPSSSLQFQTPLPGNSYRYQSCIDDYYLTETGECTTFEMNKLAVTSNTIDRYSVNVNGQFFGELGCDENFCEKWERPKFQGRYITPLSGDCSPALSQGAFVGIALGVSIGIFSIAFVVCCYWRTRGNQVVTQGPAGATATNNVSRLHLPHVAEASRMEEAVAVPIKKSAKPMSVQEGIAEGGKGDRRDGSSAGEEDDDDEYA